MTGTATDNKHPVVTSLPMHCYPSEYHLHCGENSTVGQHPYTLLQPSSWQWAASSNTCPGVKSIQSLLNDEAGLTTAEIYKVVVLPNLDGADDLFHQVEGRLSINLQLERHKGVQVIA